MSLLSSSPQVQRPGASLSSPVSRGPLDRPAVLGSWFQRRCRAVVLATLRDIRQAGLTLTDPLGEVQLGTGGGDLAATLQVHDLRAYPMILGGGSLAAAEAYLRGYWDADPLVTTMRILSRQAAVFQVLERRGGRWREPVRVAWNALRRNTRSGSRRNIAAHYDLSNAFFQLMLDPTMTYSCGIFAEPTDSLETASRAKYDRICRKLRLTPADHVLEIGCGWGGFALYAATHYGCRVTATTISQRQLEWAQRQIRAAGREDRVQLIRQDYRDLSGQFDKLVSIEMIEAVGKKYLDTFFRQCCRLLKPDGLLVLQAITMPDYRYDDYRRSVDFIRRYVFPGGFLPSFAAIGQALRRTTDFQLLQQEDLSPHYVTTLARWRANFAARLADVRALGFDERFIRTWYYYLTYCEAGFAERQTGVSQLTLFRPDCRDASPL